MQKFMTVCATAGAILAGLSMSAHAMADSPKRVDIPAGELRQALLQVSEQFGTDLVYSPEQVQGIQTRGAHGELTTEQAIARLLEGTSLELRTDPSDAMLIASPASSSSLSGQEKKSFWSRLRLAQTSQGDAQDARERTATRQTEHAAGQSAVPLAAGQESGGLDEIIVTAQRRSQNIQEVPISVTAASGEALQQLGVRSTTDLGVLAPSVSFARGTAGAAITVRGVGGSNGGGDEPANAVYVDGVYMPAPAALLFNFNNIERIEVLKGPQGTLFGRNATGGLIQIITKTPSHTPTGNFEVGYGNYEALRSSAYLSTGVTDTLAVDVAGVYENQGEGWGTNVATGRDAYKGKVGDVRGKALWNISDDTTVTATALYSYIRSLASQGATIFSGERSISGAGNTGFFNQDAEAGSSTVTEQQNYSLTVNHDFGGALFNSITSRDVTDVRFVFDADLSALNQLTVDIVSPVRSWTQEFQIASPQASRVQWVLGAFYYENSTSVAPQQLIGLNFAPLAYRQFDVEQQTKSHALYGQATIPVASATNLTAGLRYTEDRRHMDGSTSTSNTSAAPIVFPTVRATDEKVTWRLALDQKLSDAVLAYASYSRGFKSGLFNITAPTVPPVKPQTIDAYEIGLKSDLLDERVRINLSAFHYDVDDLQIRGILPPVATPNLYNAGRAKVDGVELELNSAISSRLSLQANLAYLDGRYGSFSNALFYSVNAAPGFGLTQLPPGDATDNRTMFTPEWAGTLAAQYLLPTTAGEFKLTATYSYNDGEFYDAQNRIGNQSIHLINGSIIWETKADIAIRLWANNLADEHYYQGAYASNFGNYYFPAAPRTYGVSVGWGF